MYEIVNKEGVTMLNNLELTEEQAAFLASVLAARCQLVKVVRNRVEPRQLTIPYVEEQAAPKKSAKKTAAPKKARKAKKDAPVESDEWQDIDAIIETLKKNGPMSAADLAAATAVDAKRVSGLAEMTAFVEKQGRGRGTKYAYVNAAAGASNGALDTQDELP